MNSKLLIVSLAAVVAAVSEAQPARLVWSRTSASPGVNLDTARTGIVASNGRFVVAGAVKPVGVPSVGAMATIDRRTAAAVQNTFASPLGGPLEFWKMVEFQNHYYVVGSTRPIGGNADSIILFKVDQTLTTVATRVFAANTYIGHEKPTDIEIDAAGNIYITGVAQKNNIWQQFLVKIDPTLTSLNNVFSKTDFSNYNEPVVNIFDPNNIIVGFVSNAGPMLKRYNPAGGQIGQYVASAPGNTVRAKFAEETASGVQYFAFSWVDPNGGVPESHGAAMACSLPFLAPLQRLDYQIEPGNDTLAVADIRTSAYTTRRVNTLFQRSGRAALQSLDSTLNSMSIWVDAIPGALPAFGATTAWGDVTVMLSRNNNIVNAYGLAVNNAPRFSLLTPAYNLVLPSMEQANLYHPGSGDILNVRTDNDRMQLTSFQQAPVAVTNSYSPKSGVLFRPVLPVTNNDRFADGATLSISTAPAHGTVTIGQNGYFNYTSTPGYTGPDSFRYTLTKPGLTPSSATVNLTVTP